MLNKVKQFITGFLVATFLFCSIGIYADNQAISVFFNNIKISINGKNIVMDTEPFIYAGRTYVPVRFVAEEFDKVVKYNETTDTVEITDRVVTEDVLNPIPTPTPNISIPTPSPSKPEFRKTGLAPKIEIDGKEYTIINAPNCAYYDNNDNLYFDDILRFAVHGLAFGTYTLPEYFKDSIYIEDNENSEIKQSEVRLYNSDKTKTYMFDTDKEIGGFKYGSNFIIPAKEFMDALGITFKITTDDVNKKLIITVK